MDSQQRSVGRLVFIGLTLLVFGLGLLVKRPDVGLFVGMGVGALAVAFMKYAFIKKGAKEGVELKKELGK